MTENRPTFRFFAQLAIILFYFFIFIKNLVEDELGLVYHLVTASYVGLGFFMTIYFFLKERSNSLLKVFVFVFVTSSLFIAFLGDNYRNEDYLLSVCYIGLAFIPIKFTLDYRLFLFFCIGILAFFSIFMVLGFSPDDVFPRVSRNFISIFLLVGCGYHLLASWQNNKRPLFVLIFLTFILSIWATGRAGIISSAILLISYPLSIRLKAVYKFVIIIVLLVSLFFLYFEFESLLYDFGLGRFKAMGLQSERSLVNSDYLNKTQEQLKFLFLGTPLWEVPSIVRLELNPHNSLIRLHVYYGIFVFVTIIVFIISSLYSFFKKRDYLVFFLLLALLIRAYLDSAAFHGPLDPLILSLLFFKLKNKIII